MSISERISPCWPRVAVWLWLGAEVGCNTYLSYPLVSGVGGVLVGPVEINPRDLMQREAEVKGVMLGLASEEEKEETYT